MCNSLQTGQWSTSCSMITEHSVCFHWQNVKWILWCLQRRACLWKNDFVKSVGVQFKYFFKKINRKKKKTVPKLLYTSNQNKRCYLKQLSSLTLKQSQFTPAFLVTVPGHFISNHHHHQTQHSSDIFETSTLHIQSVLDKWKKFSPISCQTMIKNLLKRY